MAKDNKRCTEHHDKGQRCELLEGHDGPHRVTLPLPGHQVQVGTLGSPATWSSSAKGKGKAKG